LKTGDVVTVENVTGKIIRFQPKTQDVIVKDDSGKIHTFLYSRLANQVDVSIDDA
jgi:hypothetical protein